MRTPVVLGTRKEYFFTGNCIIVMLVDVNKRTGGAEIGWRPAPEKNIETMPCWGKKNSPGKCLVDLGRDTRTSTQSPDLFGGKTPTGA